MSAALFASTGLSILSVVVIFLEFLSIIALCIGLLSYRHIVFSHKAFFFSFQNGKTQARQESIGPLFWLYLLSTVFLILLTGAIYMRLLGIF